MTDSRDMGGATGNTWSMKSYSQSGQDLFAFAMTDGKRNGFYLDIGCNHESFHSNTYGLEGIGWTGILVDIVGGCENRKGKFFQCDAANPSDALRFAYCQMPPVADYLSLDADAATIPAMHSIPWESVTFRVVTVEHDKYKDGNDAQVLIFGMLHAMGYYRVCIDVLAEGYGAFEDWYVHPDLVSPELISKYQCVGKDGKEIMKCALSL